MILENYGKPRVRFSDKILNTSWKSNVSRSSAVNSIFAAGMYRCTAVPPDICAGCCYSLKLTTTRGNKLLSEYPISYFSCLLQYLHIWHKLFNDTVVPYVTWLKNNPILTIKQKYLFLNVAFLPSRKVCYGKNQSGGFFLIWLPLKVTCQYFLSLRVEI